MEAPPPVTINNKTYKSLADGKYDVIFVSTGLKECILAGLLAVRGWKVLQMDRNPYYGGGCATLNLEELYKHYKKPYDAKQAEARFQAPRKFLVDLVPKFLMANGNVVKMLIQTGVTRYIDFNGVAGSYVVAQSMFSGASIYRVPVTPTEAFKSTLVGAFQKKALVSFATWLDKYKVSEKKQVVTGGSSSSLDRMTPDEFLKAIEAYYEVHNPEKKGEVKGLVEQFKDRPRATLVTALEKKYSLAVFPEEMEVEFQPGPLGLRIDPRKLDNSASVAVKSVIRIQGFQPTAEGGPGQGERSGKIKPGDFISKIAGVSVLGLPDAETTKRIVETPRPVKITFQRPPAHETAPVAPPPSEVAGSVTGPDPTKMTMAQLYAHFGLDESSQTFIGHAMALETSDAYLTKNAEPTVEKIQLYGRSVGRYGQNSPYLYPMYGLSSLPEGFSRLAAIYGGTVMLRSAPDEILLDATGKVLGVRVGEEAASARFVVGDASYFPPRKSQVLKRVVRSICVLKHPIANTSGGDSCQIIIPAKEVKRVHDIYISCVSAMHQVTPTGFYLCICSTVVETENPTGELTPAFALLGAIEERFDSVEQVMGPAADAITGEDGMLICSSLDETSHFESASADIMDVYRRVFGKPLDLSEKLVADDQQGGGQSNVQGDE